MQKEECARGPPVSLFTNESFNFNKCECLQKQGDDYEDSMDQ